MAGLWKVWKAKTRLPPLSTSPLGISPTAGEIPTFPQRRRRRRMEKWKTKSRFPTFPPPRFLSQKDKPRRRSEKPTKGDIAQHCRFSGSPRIGIEEPFQAHPVLESILDFRLISGLENAAHTMA